jgi:hypothetical protein
MLLSGSFARYRLCLLSCCIATHISMPFVSPWGKEDKYTKPYNPCVCVCWCHPFKIPTRFMEITNLSVIGRTQENNNNYTQTQQSCIACKTQHKSGATKTRIFLREGQNTLSMQLNCSSSYGLFKKPPCNNGFLMKLSSLFLVQRLHIYQLTFPASHSFDIIYAGYHYIVEHLCAPLDIPLSEFLHSYLYPQASQSTRQSRGQYHSDNILSLSVGGKQPNITICNL